MGSIEKRKDKKREHILQLILTVAIIVTIAVAAGFVRLRADLTSDKRYTLSEHTQTMLKDLNDVVYFKVYLEGDLPPGFERLKIATRQILEEFREYGGDNIHFEFINPSESTDKETRNKVYEQLYKKGLDPTNLHVKQDDGSSSQQLIWPGIIVSYRQEEKVVNILKQYTGLSSEATLNQSVQALEYNLTLAMDDLINLMGAEIGLVYGHKELEPLHIDDFIQSMSSSFRVYRTQLDGNLTALKDSLGRNRFDLIVIAQPMSAFSEMDKFLIDQHIMHGGRALWLIDALNVSLDSLAYNRNTLALENNLNLDDQLFKYGVRINKNLIQDMQCAVIPVNMAIAGQAPQFAPAPWVFFPLLQPSNNHAITKNLDMIKTQFASSIDTVGSNSKINKTILLSSSKYSRFINAPALVDLSIIDDKLDEQRYNRGNQAVAVLLEGQFNSIYENRIPPDLANNQEVDFREVSKRTKMIVISDGDVIRNAVKYNEGTAEPLPLGYDRFTKETFGNKDFLVNAVNYLCDRNALLESRKKEIKLRLLDKPRIQKERMLWQLINVVAPTFLALLFGIGYIYIRKRRFQ